MASCLYLVKAGYGSLREVEEFDSKEFLDCLEYEEIKNAIESHQIEEASNNG
jgi:hypothetical protein